MLKFDVNNLLELSKNAETKKARSWIVSMLHQKGLYDRVDEKVICLAYLALIIKNTDTFDYYNLDFGNAIDHIEDIEIKDFVMSKVNAKLFNGYFIDITGLSDDKLLGIIYSNDFDGYETRSTPNSITNLVIKLLDIDSYDSHEMHKSKTVADICCGTGNFLLKSSAIDSTNRYYGCDINTDSYGISKIRASLVRENIEIELTDAFRLLDDDRRFDYIFINHPFGMRIHQLKDEYNMINLFSHLIPKMSNSTSCDWLFALLGISKLSEKGKLAIIVTNSCLYNGLDSKVREYMINNKLIESIIELPTSMFFGTGVATSVIVFSKNNNEKINFINATKFYEKGRRQNQFTEENINTILTYIGEDSDYSISLDVSDINKEGYQLNPLRYIKTKELEIDDGVPFESVILNVFRGAPLKASELDEFASNEETDYQYIMLSNIKDGVIDKELPYLNYISEKYEKYCIKNRSLLVSKNGAPFKTAVAEIEKGKKILANGNLYVFELDETKVNPYYLQSFFTSDVGQKLLSKFTVGSAIPNLPIQDFKKAIIPLPSMEIQNRVAEEYAATVDEINIIKAKLERAKRKLKESFDKGREG